MANGENIKNDVQSASNAVIPVKREDVNNVNIPITQSF